MEMHGESVNWRCIREPILCIFSAFWQLDKTGCGFSLGSFANAFAVETDLFFSFFLSLINLAHGVT